MDPTSRDRARFRVLFVPYACGLVIWLVLGILPTFAADVPVIHHQFLTWAQHSQFARRVVYPASPGNMGPDMTTAAQASLQYTFSLLNFGLGMLLFARRWDQLVPRLLAFALLGTAATFNMPSHRAFHITGTPWPIKLIHFTFHVVSGVTYLWAVILFPNGQLPRRFRLSPGKLRVAAAAVTAVVAFVCWRGSFLAHPQFFVIFFGVAVSIAGVGVQILRSTDPAVPVDERRTARLLTGALLPALATGLAWLAGRLAGALGWTAADAFDSQVETWFPAVFALVPIVLVVSVVRYRLWDVDRALSALLGYAAIACTVGVGYVLAVTGGGYLAGGGMVATVVVLTVVAVAIEPLRVRAHRWANQVIFGKDLSPTEAIRSLVVGFSRLTPTGEIDQLTEVAVRATRAQAAALWLVDGDEWTVASTHPSQVAAPERERSWPVMYHGEQLGVLAVRGELAAVDDALIADLSAHAGLVVHNALLTVQLARQVAALTEQTAELSRIRGRLVETQDAERRRLERNLHDGAQQGLVAGIAAIGTAAVTRPQGPDLARTTAHLRRVLSDARDSTLELCGDGRPPPLLQLGLPGAIRRLTDLAAESGVHAELEVPELRLPPEIEAAAYFCCAEALQNVAKYARATTVAVTLRVTGDELHFSVTDNGRGFDPQATDQAGGLSALQDRLSGVGGRLAVSSARGSGTNLQATIPVPA